MKASDILLSLDGAAIEVRKYQKMGISVGVRYQNCDIKDGCFLIGEQGCGETFEEACEAYLKKIRGKTLVFNACSPSRSEVKVLG